MSLASTAGLSMLLSAAASVIAAAEDMPGLVPPAKPGRLVCSFDLQCVIGKVCEPVSISGEVSVEASGSVFGQKAFLRFGEETILLQPPTVEGGDWIEAEFSRFYGLGVDDAWILTRTAAGDTVYTIHAREDRRAVSWHGSCDEVTS